MTRHHRVAIVFDEHARAQLSTLARRCPVWAVDSNENQAAAQDFWRQCGPTEDELAFGVTTFTRTQEAPEDALAVVLELVEDHHGEFAQDPPVDEVLVVGLEPTEALLGVLNEWGYGQIGSHPEGLVARRVGVGSRP